MILLLSIMTWANQNVYGQTEEVLKTIDRIVNNSLDSTVVDFERTKKEIKRLEKTAKKIISDTLDLAHSPRRASIYAAIMPGLGQLYNKNYFKASLVYAGLGTFVYFVNWNNNEYVKYKQAFIDISDDDPSSRSYENLGLEGRWDLTNPGHVSMLTTRLEAMKEYTRRNRDLCIIGTAAFYTISIIEATVSAHFFNFDISDDLSFNWMVQPMKCMDQSMIGINCVINIK